MGVHHADAEVEVAGFCGECGEEVGEGGVGVVAVCGGVLGGEVDVAAAGVECVGEVGGEVGDGVAVEGSSCVVGDAVGAGVVAAFGDGNGGGGGSVVFGKSGGGRGVCGWFVGDEVGEVVEVVGWEEGGVGCNGGDEVGLDGGHAAGDDEWFAGVLEESDAGEHALFGAVDDGAGEEEEDVGLVDGGDDGVVGLEKESVGGAGVALVGGAAVGLEVDVHWVPRVVGGGWCYFKASVILWWTKVFSRVERK